jgi:hypothetical protein
LTANRRRLVCDAREIDSARKASNYIVMMETHTSGVCVYCQNLQLIGVRIAQSASAASLQLGRGEKMLAMITIAEGSRSKTREYRYSYVE